jgi:hypothetical protein
VTIILALLVTTSQRCKHSSFDFSRAMLVARIGMTAALAALSTYRPS